jgi:hypothetical protein
MEIVHKQSIKVTQPWLWLTWPLASLLIIAGAAGYFVEDLYYLDSPLLAAQFLGQDLIVLVVTVPVLAVSAILAGRGSPRALLVWLGTLIYLVYTYVIYSFCAYFNALFLVYVAILGCSLYGLIFGLAQADWHQIKALFLAEAPVKVVSVSLGILTALFYLSSVPEIVPSIVTGGIPQSVIDYDLPTNFTHVLDMAACLPAMALAAIFLWQRKPIGYGLAGALLLHISMMGTALIAMFISMGQHGLEVSWVDLTIFGTITVIGLGLLIWYLNSLKE